MVAHTIALLFITHLQLPGRETVFAPLVTSVRPVILFTHPGLSFD
jgi:hypothetical protein